MATILVTGGAGYIGSHACRALAAAGHLPVTLDDFSTGWRDAVRFGPLVEASIADRAALDHAFAAHRPDAVVHFAARSLVGESVADPCLYWRQNVAGTLTLLEAMRDHGVCRLVFSSTAAVYGEPDVALISESTAPAPVNPYGATKRAIEDMIHGCASAHGLRAVVFRYFNVAGAAADGTVGEQHRPETHLVPLVLEAATGRRPPLTVLGTDYPTADGTCVRDYIHVEDLAEAHVLGIDRLLGGTGAEPVLVCNLGNGTGYSVREVIAEAAGVLGRPVPFELGARRAGDPARLVCDPARARTLLGWAARRGLGEMIGSAAAWHDGPGHAR